MIQLAYLSSACELFDGPALIRLLQRARVRNEEEGITGLLLYKDGNFLQVLEGEEGAVRRLFSCIEADRRHKDVLVMIDELTPARTFPDWSMGFRDLTQHEARALPSYTALMDDLQEKAGFGADPTGCLALIEQFRHGR